MLLFTLQLKVLSKQMNNHEKHLEDLHEIRAIMERSARFISLSGLSGISAGIFALIGALIAYQRFDISGLRSAGNYYTESENLWFAVFIAMGVLICSVAAGIFFTTRNAKKKGQKIFDRTTWHLLINLAVPLIAGGLFCIILLNHSPELISSAMLMFYGMALLNASKYTLPDIRYLGICEIVLGLIGGLFPGYGLLLWAIGFGVLHIVYGTVMYFKYER